MFSSAAANALDRSSASPDSASPMPQAPMPQAPSPMPQALSQTPTRTPRSASTGSSLSSLSTPSSLSSLSTPSSLSSVSTPSSEAPNPDAASPEPDAASPDAASPESTTSSRTVLSDDDRQKVLCVLLQNLVGKNKKRIANGVTAELCDRFNIGKTTLKRIMRQYWKEETVKSSKKGKCGRPKRPVEELEGLRNLPESKRSCLKDISKELNISVSTLSRRLREGTIKKRNVFVKPFLTPEQRQNRVKFVFENMNLETGMMNDGYQHIHVDEKWFYLKKLKKTYYMLPDEETPHNAAKNKNHIPKIMFFAAVARPRHCTRTNTHFNGLLGCWPFIVKEPAVKNSKNRPKGTLVTKAITKVTQKEHRDMMMTKLLPVIKERWPESFKSQPIVIQMDNCRVHTKRANDEFLEAAKKEGLNIVLKPQPAVSPDFNVLDLGFFTSIQNLKERMKDPADLNELITRVDSAFNQQPSRTLDKVFLSLQCAMMDSLSVYGCNRYKLRHMGKDKILNQRGSLPASLECDPAYIARGREVVDPGAPSVVEVAAI